MSSIGTGHVQSAFVDAPLDVARIFELIGKELPSYIRREQQLELGQSIARAFDSGKVGVFEAGTGVGKSLSALIPAALSRKRVVVSTATISLQDQYISKDIPLLTKALPFSIDVALMKGRGNYLGLRRFEDYLREQLVDDEFVHWARSTDSGDQSELEFLPPYELWAEVNSDGDDCLRNKCPKFNSCFYFEARKRTEKADLIVVNHALLLADAASRGAILPKYDYLIIDEAHHLNSIATEAFSNAVSTLGIRRLTGRATKQLQAPMGLVDDVEREAIDLFRRLNNELRYMKMRLLKPVQEACHLKSALESLMKWLSEQKFENLINFELAQEKAKLKANALISTIENYIACLELVIQPSDSWVTWVEKRDVSGSRMAIVAAPLDVSEYISELLLEKPGVESTVFMSATLATAGDDAFRFFKESSGITGPVVQALYSSPFDYRNKALLYLPKNMPDPNSPQYLYKVGEQIERLVEISSGRAFALFTSKSALNRVFDDVAARLPYPARRQGDMPRKALIEWFQETPNAILFGTSSFWEGVSVDGEQLSCVIIDRIPFQVPDDPVYEARCERMKQDTEKNWFNNLALPHATTRLKQGVGRLIRTVDDTGIVAILDPRLTEKFYGRRVIQCLPPMKVTQRITDVEDFFRAIDRAK